MDRTDLPALAALSTNAAGQRIVTLPVRYLGGDPNRGYEPATAEVEAQVLAVMGQPLDALVEDVPVPDGYHAVETWIYSRRLGRRPLPVEDRPIVVAARLRPSTVAALDAAKGPGDSRSDVLRRVVEGRIGGEEPRVYNLRSMSVLAAETAGRTAARHPGRWVWEVYCFASGTSRDADTALRACTRAANRAVRQAGGGNSPATTVAPCAYVVEHVPAAHAAYLAAGGE